MDAINVVERDGWKKWDLLIPHSQSTDNPRPESEAWHPQHGDWELSSSGTRTAESSGELVRLCEGTASRSTTA